MKLEIYLDAQSYWRWRMVARNHRIIAESGEGYSSRSGVERAIKTAARGMRSARVVWL